MATRNDANTSKFSPGEWLFAEGTPADRVFIINSGHVRIMRKVFRESVTIETLGKGNVCGEVALAEGATYPVSAIADDDVEAVVVPREKLASMMLSNPKVIERLASRLAARLTQAHFRVASLSVRDVLGRVMLQLRHEAQRAGALDGATSAAIPFDLSDALASERGAVDRALRMLVSDGLVELDGAGRFRILDLAAWDRRLHFIELRDRIEG
jgi:CRP/FNR family transcriptional regulator